MNFRQPQPHHAILWLWLGLFATGLLGGCQIAPISESAAVTPAIDEPVATLVSPSTENSLPEKAIASQPVEIMVTPEQIVATTVPTPTIEQAIPEVSSSPTPEQTNAEDVTQKPFRYTVATGDTLYAIAAQFGVSLDDIVRVNQLVSPDRIDIGQDLIIPVGSSVAPLAVLPTVTAAVAESESKTLPILSDAVYSCPENTTVYQLELPSDPIQILAEQDRLYLIADGSLYELGLENILRNQPVVPTNLMPPDKIVGNYLIREFVYLTRDTANGDLLLLDKTNDIYRYSRSGIWTMEVAAQPVPGQFPDPQYLTIQAKRGSILALDSDLSHIWEVSKQRPMPTAYIIDREIESAVDMALVQSGNEDIIYILNREGSVTRFGRLSAGQSNTSLLPTKRVGWPSQVQMNNGQLMVVDGDSRNIRFYEPTNLTAMSDVTFRHPNMQRLRHAAIVDQTLYALAGRMLYVVPFSQLNNACGPVAYDDNFYFDGQNIHDLLPRVDLPFANAVLPVRPRSYPGARRLYRYGLHEGLDLYALDAPGLHTGSPVRSIADGKVIRVDSGFVEMTPNEYEIAMQQTKNLHRTGAVLTDKLLGRQVHVEHSAQVVTRYGHLNEVSSTIYTEAFAQMGTAVGTVGLSGTSAGVYGTGGGEHLHFEIWVNGRYLGQGLSLYETIRLWQEIFR